MADSRPRKNVKTLLLVAFVLIHAREHYTLTRIFENLMGPAALAMGAYELLKLRIALQRVMTVTWC